MNDPEIRELLIKKYLTKYQNTDNCLILEEVGIMHGSSIVDLTVISKFYNQAFEIKSAQDSLTRLPKQLKDYLQVFDYITIISQPSHLDEILGIAPHFVGIILVYDNGDLEYLRKPTANPFLRKEKLIQLLWRDEVYAFLREKGHKKNFSPIKCEGKKNGLFFVWHQRNSGAGFQCVKKASRLEKEYDRLSYFLRFFSMKINIHTIGEKITFIIML